VIARSEQIKTLIEFHDHLLKTKKEAWAFSHFGAAVSTSPYRGPSFSVSCVTRESPKLPLE